MGSVGVVGLRLKWLSRCWESNGAGCLRTTRQCWVSIAAALRAAVAAMSGTASANTCNRGEGGGARVLGGAARVGADGGSTGQVRHESGLGCSLREARLGAAVAGCRMEV